MELIEYREQIDGIDGALRFIHHLLGEPTEAEIEEQYVRFAHLLVAGGTETGADRPDFPAA